MKDPIRIAQLKLAEFAIGAAIRRSTDGRFQEIPA